MIEPRDNRFPAKYEISDVEWAAAITAARTMQSTTTALLVFEPLRLRHAALVRHLRS
jgi:hypothetical protein